MHLLSTEAGEKQMGSGVLFQSDGTPVRYISGDVRLEIGNKETGTQVVKLGRRQQTWKIKPWGQMTSHPGWCRRRRNQACALGPCTMGGGGVKEEEELSQQQRVGWEGGQGQWDRGSQLKRKFKGSCTKATGGQVGRSLELTILGALNEIIFVQS